MKKIKPLHDKVLAVMIEPIGIERRTRGGMILTEKNFGEDTIRSRWFKIMYVGDEQKDVKPGQYVLMPHGRWSRGLDLDGTHREEDKLFLLDNNDMLATTDQDPLVEGW
jgi:co-chaperonin GroES (HSP10)